MRIGASSSEINHPGFLLVEHRGEPITLNDLALIADSLPKRGLLNQWQQALAFAGGVLVLAACTPAPGHEVTTSVPITSIHPTETPHVDPTATSLHPTEINITPSPFVTGITPEVIQVAAASLPPAYVAGIFDIIHLPDNTQRVEVGTNTAVSKELSAHHLVPIEDGTAASYQTSNNRSYAAMLGEVFDKASSQVLKSNGAADEQGIVSYTSPDGLVTQYFPSIVPCEEGKDCFTVVSFDPSDSSVTYWVQVDHTTGKLEKYMPAIYPSLTELNTALKTGFRALEKDKWSSALHGSAALAQTGEVMGVSYEAGNGAAMQGGLMFMVTENNKNVVEQARDKDIMWKGGVLTAKNESGTFVWDHNKNEWMQAVLDKNLKDGAPVYQAGEKQFISVDGNLQPVTVDTTTDGKSTIKMQDGTQQVWEMGKWVIENPIVIVDKVPTTLKELEALPHVPFEDIYKEANGVQSSKVVDQLQEAYQAGKLGQYPKDAIPFVPIAELNSPLQAKYGMAPAFYADNGASQSDGDRRPDRYPAYFLTEDTTGHKYVIFYQMILGANQKVDFVPYYAPYKAIEQDIKILSRFTSDASTTISPYIFTKKASCASYFGAYTSACDLYYQNEAETLAAITQWTETGKFDGIIPPQVPAAKALARK